MEDFNFGEEERGIRRREDVGTPWEILEDATTGGQESRGKGGDVANCDGRDGH